MDSKVEIVEGNYVRYFWVSVGRGVGGRGSGLAVEGRGRGAGAGVEGEGGDEAWVWKQLHGGAECGAGEAVDKRVLPMR